MKSLDLKNKMWFYSSILFMGSLLIITLSVIGYYGIKAKGIVIKPRDNVVITQKDKQIKDLQNQNQSLQQELVLIKNKPEGNIDAYNKLMQVQDFINREDYTSAMNLMTGLNKNDFQGFAKDKYSTVTEQINTKAAMSFYTNGMTAYRKGDNRLAAEELTKAVQYGPTQSFADRAAYYTSLSYRALGDDENEKKYLEIVINNYPKSTFQYKAKLRYNAL